MTYDVEERLAVALRTRAEAPVDADALLAGALVAGRARARRHRLVTAGGAGVAGMTAAALVAVPLALAPAGRSAGPDVGFAGDLPVLPAAQGQAGAAQRPDLVGIDPTVLRFGLSGSPLPVQGVDWGSVGGVEHIRVQLVDGRWGVSAVVELAHGTLPPSEWDDPTTTNIARDVRVNGRLAVAEDDPVAPGGMPRRWVRWSPVDGLEMRVGLIVDSYYDDAHKGGDATVPSFGKDAIADDPTFLTDLAATIRLDTTTRCGAPARLTAPPDGARLTGCVAGGGPAPDTTLAFSYAKLTVSDAGGTLEVSMSAPEYPSPVPSESRYDPGPTVDTPSPAAAATGTPGPGSEASPQPTGVAQFNHDGVVGEVIATGGYGQRAAEDLAGGVRAAGDPREPSTWPLSPLG
jgi:hypothetical protein